jgi:hypothetical protein
MPDPHSSEYYDWQQANHDGNHNRPESRPPKSRESTGMSLPGIYSDEGVAMQRTASGYSINALAGTGASTGMGKQCLK